MARYMVNPRGWRPCRLMNPLTGNGRIHGKTERLRGKIPHGLGREIWRHPCLCRA